MEHCKQLEEINLFGLIKMEKKLKNQKVIFLNFKDLEDHLLISEDDNY